VSDSFLLELLFQVRKRYNLILLRTVFITILSEYLSYCSLEWAYLRAPDDSTYVCAVLVE